MAPRKTSEIWNAVKDKCPDGVDFTSWKSTYEGIKTALGYLGLELVTTKEEYEALETPKYKNGKTSNMHKKIVASRNGIKSSPTQIGNLLSGRNSILTDGELKILRDKQSKIQKEKQPKGEIVYSNYEKKGIENLHNLLQMESELKAFHTLEFRRADVIYCKANDDINGCVFAADQVKVAHEGSNGMFKFSHTNDGLRVKHIVDFLENNMSLTCIGMKKHCDVHVVWFFYGKEVIEILKMFDQEKYFLPRLYMKRKVSKPLSVAINDPRFRYDVKQLDECNRLKESKLRWVDMANKNTIQYYNEDDSQIVSFTHRIEQQSFNLIRNALMQIGKTMHRIHENNYTVTDFTIDDCRVQSKACDKDVMLRRPGKLPYNPDTFDIFQIVNIPTKTVIAIPTRKYDNHEVVSTFTAKELMTNGTIKISIAFKHRFSEYILDMEKVDDIMKYYKICQESKNIPFLSDKSFYDNLVNNNKDKFFPIKHANIKINAHV